MDAGVVYVSSTYAKAYRDDNSEYGPYVYDNFGDLSQLNKAWILDDWRPLPAEPAWKPEPFERVICRDDDSDLWRCSEFSHETHKYFQTTGVIWKQIAPYAGNEDCVGTTKPAKNVLKK